MKPQSVYKHVFLGLALTCMATSLPVDQAQARWSYGGPVVFTACVDIQGMPQVDDCWVVTYPGDSEWVPDTTTPNPGGGGTCTPQSETWCERLQRCTIVCPL